MALITEYKCPNCGGNVEFSSSSQMMKCPYCDTEFDVEVLEEVEKTAGKAEDDFTWESSAGGQWEKDEEEKMSVYVCNSCGGEIICDGTTGAATCPYCDSNVVFSGVFSGDLKPDLVIPFKLDKKAAKEALKKHLSDKKLLSKVFKEENHIDEIKGVYVPFWLFDADAEGTAHFRGVKTRSWSSGDYIYTENSYYQVIRSGGMSFAAVPVDGSSKMADDLMESIEPFDLSEAVDFNTAYLSGYLADRYDVDDKQSTERANERIKNSLTDTLRSTVVGYSSVTPQNTSIKLSGGSVKYALYPVWILNTTWKDKKYTFAMNGQTGKFVGNLPLDKGAFAKMLLGIGSAASAAAFALIYIITSFM